MNVSLYVAGFNASPALIAFSVGFTVRGVLFWSFRTVELGTITEFMVSGLSSALSIIAGGLAMYVTELRRPEETRYQFWTQRPFLSRPYSLGELKELQQYPSRSAIQLRDLWRDRSDIARFRLQEVIAWQHRRFAAVQAFLATYSAPFQPSARPGHRRLLWRCECGELISVDIKYGEEPSWATAPIVDTNLNSTMQPTSRSSSSSMSVSADATPHASTPNQDAKSAGKYLAAASSGTRSGLAEQDSDANDSDGVATHGASSNASFSDPPDRQRYFGVCINSGLNQHALEEIEVSIAGKGKIRSDGGLFREIRGRYNQVRSRYRTHRWGLVRPGGVNYVQVGCIAFVVPALFTDGCEQFCVADAQVGILQTPNAMPPDQSQYEFAPCPMTDPPPVPASIFLHLMTSDKTHSRATWLLRLPKKRDSRILPAAADLHKGINYATGWGVHIVEVPNEQALLWITGAYVGFNLLVAIVYAIVSRGDVQSAFSIAAFLVASESVMTLAFFQSNGIKTL